MLMAYMQKKNKQTKQEHATSGAMKITSLDLASMLPGHHNLPPPPSPATFLFLHRSHAHHFSLSTIWPTSRLLSIAQASAVGERDGTAAQAGVQLCGAGLCLASRSRRGLRQLRHRRRRVPAKAPCVQQPLLLQLRRPHLQLPCPRRI
jgi:hypothetical protein